MRFEIIPTVSGHAKRCELGQLALRTAIFIFVGDEVTRL